jgi:AraC family transcriptional regulator
MLTPRISSPHVRATRYDRKSREVLDWHEHQDLSLCFVIRGDYEETTRHQRFTCRSGDVVIKAGDVRHLNRFGQRGAECLLLEISAEFSEESAAFTQPAISGPVHSQQLTRIGLELHEELRVPDRLSPFMLDGIAIRSLVSVLRIEGEKSKRQAQVEAMRQLLDSGAGIEDLTRRYLTAGEGKNVRQLFYETEGCSLSTYVLRRRAFRAFDELLNTDRSLAEIAIRAGFYDQAHFTKVFGKLFGVTPGQLRSRVRNH